MSDVEDAGKVVLGGLGVGGVISAREERKAAERDAERARKAQDRIRQIKEARQRRAAIREARLQRAQLQQGAVTAGAQGSSSVVTGVGGITSQLGANLSFLDQVGELQQQASLFQSAAAKHASKTQDFQAVSDLSFRAAAAVAGGG